MFYPLSNRKRSGSNCAKIGLININENCNLVYYLVIKERGPRLYFHQIIYFFNFFKEIQVECIERIISFFLIILRN